jgi:hypothetical protein
MMPSQLSDAYFENMFTAAGAGTHNMVEFFDLMSQGTLDLAGSKVSTWIPLPYEQADYVGKIATVGMPLVYVLTVSDVWASRSAGLRGCPTAVPTQLVSRNG